MVANPVSGVRIAQIQFKTPMIEQQATLCHLWQVARGKESPGSEVHSPHKCDSQLWASIRHQQIGSIFVARPLVYFTLFWLAGCWFACRKISTHCQRAELDNWQHATLQYCNIATLRHCNSAALQLCNCNCNAISMSSWQPVTAA